MVSDPVTFLNVAGGMAFALCCFSCCGAAASFKDDGMEANEFVPRLAACVNLFYLAWAGVGLYMYTDEMTLKCKDEDIAQMIFAWSLLIMCTIGCCFCFGCCIFVGVNRR